MRYKLEATRTSSVFSITALGFVVASWVLLGTSYHYTGITLGISSIYLLIVGMCNCSIESVKNKC